MVRTTLAAAAFLALAPVPLLAQQPGVPAPEAVQAGQPRADPRINQLIIYGDDPCPRSGDEEVIVCARLPEDDRFRIPENFRNDPSDPAGTSWAARAIELSYVGASGIGSCSPSGGGGMTGCLNQIIQQARAERAGAPIVNWNAMIEEARRERLRRIDEAEAAERAEENSPD